MLLSFLYRTDGQHNLALQRGRVSVSVSVSIIRPSVIPTDRQRVVAGDEEDVEDGGGGEVAGQQAARVGQDGLGVDDRQAEEGDGPDPVEDLE